MKNFIMTVALMLLPALALAAPEPTTGVREQMSIGSGCETITIASHTATSVVISTKPAYTWVGVMNIDSTYAINCASHTSVSTTSTSGYYGFTVAPGNPGATVVWIIAPSQDWYCKSQGANTTSRATVCRGR